MNLGSLFSTIGGGIKSGFGALKSGIGQLGEMEDEDGEALPMMKKPSVLTPGFNPSAQMPSMKRTQVGRDDGLIKHDPRMRNPLPSLEQANAPKFEPIRDGAETMGQLPAGQIGVTPQQTQMIPERQVSELRIPNFYGGKGSYKEDDPINRAQYDYETQYMQDGKIPRRWQDIAKNAVLGLNQGFQATGDWRGGLMGAAVGGAGTAIDPLHGRGYQFQQAVQPGLEAEQKRLQQGRSESMRMKREGADLEGVKARTAATVAGMKDPQLERLKLQSQIDKQNAQAEAIRTGKPQKFVVFDPETNQYIQGWKYPDGREEYGGQSGESQLKREGYQNQNTMNKERIEGGMARVKESAKGAMDRVRVQQTGANWRTGQTQSGQNYRTGEKIKAQYGSGEAPNTIPYGPDIPPQGKPPAVGTIPTAGGASGGSERRKAIIQRAIDAGYTPQQAAAEADKRGIK